jgi:hypothetical protein
MAVSATHTGWRYDPANTRLDFYYQGTRIGHINASQMSLAAGDLALAAGTIHIQDGGTETQGTSTTTTVAIDPATNSGRITTIAGTLAAAGEETFTVTNTEVAATDTIIANVSTYGGAGTPVVFVTAVADNSFNLTVANLHASAALNALIVINWAIIKGASS